MARTYERQRKKIIKVVSAELVGADDSRTVEAVRHYCRLHDVPATESQINSMANEAIRRRMVQKIKLLEDRVVILHERVTVLEEQIVALNEKVNSFD